MEFIIGLILMIVFAPVWLSILFWTIKWIVTAVIIILGTFIILFSKNKY